MMLAVLSSVLLSDGPFDLDAVDLERLRATVSHLSSMNTRNTNTPECAEACKWVMSKFEEIPAFKGNVELMSYHITKGPRIPKDLDVVQVVATLPGKTGRTIVIGGHLDSINMAQGADPYTARAPGANDDLSGVSMTMEAARLMASRQWNATIKFVAFTGEEQGLLGSKALAARAKAENWDVEAVLSSDIVGSSQNKLGQKDDKHVRLFSEESDKHQGRELARFIEWQTRQNVKGFGVKLVFRRDRFGRGGDHTSFTAQDYAAVRFTEVFEEYAYQHTIDDLPEHMDFRYLANVTRVNLAALASLADAGEPPTGVRVVLDQSADTSLRWTTTPGTSYTVFWRATTSPVWEGAFDVGEASTYVAKRINKDDHVFAVGAKGGVPVVAR